MSGIKYLANIDIGPDNGRADLYWLCCKIWVHNRMTDRHSPTHVYCRQESNAIGIIDNVYGPEHGVIFDLAWID